MTATDLITGLILGVSIFSLIGVFAMAMKKGGQSFLVTKTGHGEVYWLRHIEKVIKANTSPPATEGKHKGHGFTDQGWPVEVVSDIVCCAKVQRVDEKGDGNMAMALCIGYVFLMWFMHVQYAKANDPNRPLKLRRRAYQNYLNFIGWIVMRIQDRKIGADVFTQAWDNPYDPGAKDGGFV